MATNHHRFQSLAWPVNAMAGFIVVVACFIYLPLGVVAFLWFLYLQLLLAIPQRLAPFGDKTSITAPLDGIITDISTDGAAYHIDIMAHFTSSQIIFCPCDGVIEDNLWIDGLYLPASDGVAPSFNARREIMIEMKTGEMIIMSLIAQTFTRLCQSPVAQGQLVYQSEPIGLSLMRARIRISVPKSFSIMVNQGQSCLGIETIIAKHP